MKTSGIPSIADESTTVNTMDLPARFGLPLHTHFYRGEDSIDMLIGIDHAKMHTGETWQYNHLLACHFPLGWIVFGGKSERESLVATILHIKYTTPVDMTDFWAMESMGIKIKPCVCDTDKSTNIEREETKVIEGSCVKVDSLWMIPYPWRRDPSLLPNNRDVAQKHLESTEKE